MKKFSPLFLMAFFVSVSLLVVSCNADQPKTPSPDLKQTPSITPRPPTATETKTATPALATAVPEPTRTATPLASVVPSISGKFKDVDLGLIPVARNLNSPVFITNAGDNLGRIFIVEKPGAIRVLQNGVVLETPFLDIRALVRSSGSEQGLLGLAFAPNFASSGYFFVNYTDLQGGTAIVRYQATPGANTADPNSAFPVLKIRQPAPNHNGGMLAFGPDGNLWIGTGDGGGAGDIFRNGQNPKSLLGKILRLDVLTDPTKPYAIPVDNPTWNDQAVAPEIWGMGVRNPWRYSFDRATGDLWVADVGQNQYEEINIIKAEQKGFPNGGINLGWPLMEATHCFGILNKCENTSQLTMPIFEYEHRDGNCSVTGGYVYRGSQINELDGVYIFGDFCSGKVWALSNEQNAWQREEIFQTSLQISSFGEDEAGELYLTTLRQGVLYQITKLDSPKS